MAYREGAAITHISWSNTLFTWGRRLIGIRFKLLLLMVAEIVGLTVYQLVSEQLEQGGFRSALEQTCGDEEDHLGFHSDFFRKQLQTAVGRIGFQLFWLLIRLMAMLIAYIDNCASFRDFSIRKRIYFRRA